MENDEGLGTKLWLEEREYIQASMQAPAPPQNVLFQLQSNAVDDISMFIKKNKLSWQDLSVAAWCILIHRLSTTDSVLIGTGDGSANADNIAFVDSIHPLSYDIKDTESKIRYLKAIANVCSSDRPALEKKNDELKYLVLNDKENERVSNEVVLNDYPLTLLASSSNPGTFNLIYHPYAYNKRTINRMVEYYQNILLELCRDQDALVVNIEIMSPEEKQKVLSEWSSPYQDDTDGLDVTPLEMILSYAKKHPDKLAVSHNDTNVTYKELADYTNSIANLLQEKGITPQDKIAVFMERTPTLVMSMLAIFQCDAVFVPINAKYPIERVEFVLGDSDAKYILANDKSKIPDKHKDKVILIPQNWTELVVCEPQLNPPKLSTNSIAYIIYTSGTTGQPKGVKIKHRSLTNLSLWYKKHLDVTPHDRASQFASQGFDTYLCETIPILTLGASVHIVDDGIKLNPHLFFDWLVREKISICDLPTAYGQILFDMEWPQDSAIRLTKIGGEACTRYPTQKLQFDLWNIYGPTETTIEVTFQKIYEAYSDVSKTHRNVTPDIGKVMGNCYVYIVDQHFNPVPEGVAGELVIGGESVSPGYHNRDDITQNKFIDDPFKKDGSKLYRTGDLAIWMANGCIEFVGRVDNQIKLRGFRIELSDIENALSKYPDVSEVVVLAKENLKGEKTLVAYVVPNLDRERFLYQERCLLSVADEYCIEAISEDISRNGIALTGVNEDIAPGSKVTLHLKLPGFDEGKNITARLVWQIGPRCGLIFTPVGNERDVTDKAIDYFISSHNVMDLVLSASAKRSLRRALKNRLPDFMVPTSFVTLLQMPLTFSGKVDKNALPPPDDFAQTLRKKFIPPKTETEKVITELWQQILRRTNISMEDNFFDLGGDSLTAVELSVKLSDKFGVLIPARILFDLSYIPIIAEYIDSGGSEYSKNSMIQEDIQRDVILPENLSPAVTTSPDIGNPKNILLTGAGGFLGIFILEQLLAQTDAKIYCLLRKGEHGSAAKRLNATIEKFGLQERVSLNNRRIIAVAGDLALDNFGIPLEQYQAMAAKVDCIYHCGAQVNIMTSYNKLRGSNVHGTLEIIKFATSVVNKAIYYISTLSSAYLKNEAGALIEEFPDTSYRDLFGGYAISKWVSERLLTQLKDRSFPVVIYRSGYISGDAKTGITSLNDALLMLIKGCIQIGYAPEMKERITILPVDYVAQATVNISLSKPSDPDVYHIDHPTGIMWADLIAWLNDYGYPIKLISMEEWKVMLKDIPNTNPLYPFLPHYLAQPNDHESDDVDNTKAAKILQENGLDYPEISNELLNNYFDYMCRVGFLTKPEKKKVTS